MLSSPRLVRGFFLLACLFTTHLLTRPFEASAQSGSGAIGDPVTEGALAPPGGGGLSCILPSGADLQDLYERMFDVLKGLGTQQRIKLWDKILRPFFKTITGKDPGGSFHVLCNGETVGKDVTRPEHLDKLKRERLLLLLEDLIRKLRGLGVDPELDGLLGGIQQIRCADAGPLPPEDPEAINNALRELKDGLNWLFFNLIVLPDAPTLYPTRPDDVFPAVVPPFCLAKPEEDPIGPILVHPGLKDELP